MVHRGSSFSFRLFSAAYPRAVDTAVSMEEHETRDPHAAYSRACDTANARKPAIEPTKLKAEVEEASPPDLQFSKAGQFDFLETLF